VLERLEALVAKGLVEDKGAHTALLGTESKPSFPLSRLFEEYETATRDETRDFSPDQLRIWRIGRIRAVAQFVKVVGDKPVTQSRKATGSTMSNGGASASWKVTSRPRQRTRTSGS
jgi:hypothetical protein